MRCKFVTVAESAVAFVLTLLSGNLPLRGAPGTLPAKTAVEQFKNIQVLKTIPADELIPTMQFISASLGVECDFCHVEHEMDKDDKKPKKTAREMMRMMFAVNQNNFSGQREVTCNTCHRGSVHPEPIPAFAAHALKSNATDHDQDDHADATELAAWPSGNSVLAKYLDALGGSPALEKVASRTEKGNVLLPGGRGVPIEIFAKSPDQRVSVMHTANGDSVTAYNGQTGWLTSPGGPLRDMSASDQYSAKLDATAMFPANLAAMFDELKLQPHTEMAGGHAATVVWGLRKGQPPVQLYFDSQSGVLVRMLHYIDTVLGLNPIQVDYSDYRDVEGVKAPYRWRITRPSGAFTIQLDEVQSNVPIDSAKFAKPETPPDASSEKAAPH